MKRKDAIAHLRIAGYHDDQRRFARLYVENRVSLEIAREAYQAGVQARSAGVRCTCAECKEREGK